MSSSWNSATSADSRTPLPELLRKAKEWGYSDRQLAYLWNASELEIRRQRKAMGIDATFRLVDTCAAEFEAYTPYYYSTYDSQDETRLSSDKDRSSFSV
ncbi:MAG: hypothetical protein U1D30_13765 [Planctomycetota bacterium]